jgi:Flp pilus assembly pilin Flp
VSNTSKNRKTLRKNRFFKGQSGQAAVEYILLLAVVVTVSVGLFKKIDEYLISNPNSLIKNYLSSFDDMFGASHTGLNLKYKRFFIRK